MKRDRTDSKMAAEKTNYTILMWTCLIINEPQFQLVSNKTACIEFSRKLMNHIQEIILQNSLLMSTGSEMKMSY